MITEKYLTELCKAYFDFKSALFKMIDGMCRQEGLTSLQALMLFVIRSEGKASVGEMSRYFNITHSNASTLCKKLEGDGLLKRTRSKEDERTVLLELTEHGSNIIENMLERGSKAAEVISEITDERQQIILSTLSETTGLLKQMNDR